MAEVTVLVTTNFSDPAAYPPLADVGTIYEVGIAGAGYMLADDPNSQDTDLKRNRGIVPMQASKMNMSQTPFSDSYDRYRFAANYDFRGGAGQTYVDRPDSQPDSYLDSEGVDPFKAYELRLLTSSAKTIPTTYATPLATVAGDRVYMQTGAKQLTHTNVLTDATGTAFSVAAATTITDLTTDGNYWYAAAGAQGVFRGQQGDPGPQWSALGLQACTWGLQRLCGAYSSSGGTPNVFTTLGDDGTEEIPGGRLTLPTGWTISSLTAGGGFVFFGAYRGNVGAIYRWHPQMPAPAVAWSLPVGEIPTALLHYQGQVMIRARKLRSSTTEGTATIYRGVTDSGGLITPAFVVELGAADATRDYGAGTWCAFGTKVFTSWPSGKADMGTSCLLAINLSSGGYARWHLASTIGTIPGIVVFQNRLCFTLGGSGLHVEQTALVSSGWIKTSLVDFAFGVKKAFDVVVLSMAPLPNGSSISVDYTLDDGGSYLTLDTVSTGGQTAATLPLAKLSHRLGLRYTLNNGVSAGPKLVLSQIRTHPVGVSDEIIVLPIDCGDEVRGLNGKDLPENGPGAGGKRVRALRALINTFVRFQDSDWIESGRPTEFFEVHRIDEKTVSLMDRKAGRQSERRVVVMTLRRTY